MYKLTLMLSHLVRYFNYSIVKTYSSFCLVKIFLLAKLWCICLCYWSIKN